ncbi:MAG: ATP-dependent Clp protease proteolytic subunit, partial [Firmicutes bacterium]|nr:ATP-dependent Clp protease proteolytic subunit [Bacillota bacterium]
MVPLALLLLSVQWAAAGAPTGVRTVYVVPIKGTVEPGLASFVERSLSTAEKEKADAVLLEINSFGGRVDAATEIRDMILEFEPPVLAYVSERAWSAAALIAIASPKLAMAPGASIGAAEPRPAEEKTISALRAEFEATAERNGRDPRIAGAMVDAELEIKDVVGKGKILTLSAEQAEKLGFVDYVAPRRQTVLAYFGYPGARLVVMRPAGAERMARFITDPVVSSLLLTVGFLGLLYELASGGWGVPGSVSLAALGLFFGGRLVAGLAGWEVLVLFLAGLGLLFLEASVIPGFGVAGFAG